MDVIKDVANVRLMVTGAVRCLIDGVSIHLDDCFPLTD